ncbi:RidA family protein [Roseinatronobacter sp. S2]|uniref:RidA family protein n=1 Tax=Roseinatronobacter sp. S2 TaxID=3035471 RepID=UPI00241003E6|nr:RidA family protein [Roseinatronobacter sp. S2]MCC5960191.1 RidA family protein [Paracoccaceae bacterium]WFE75378.1 RidA family protein [Roseinatronobacter sp. S2]
MLNKTLLPALAASLLLGGVAQAEVVRHKNPGSDFPILRAVEIPADATLVYLSGAVPGVTNTDAEPNTAAAFGDTEAQTISVLGRINSTLEDLDLTMSDVVKMQVYLVADDSGQMDFGGFMDGYVQFFGTEDQPNLPTRSVFEVAGLANPHWLVEIEVVAVRP